MLDAISSNELRTVLIVDDNRENLSFLERVLIDAGYRVSSLRTGKGVLERVIRIKPSLILLDVVLPDVDGYAICVELKGIVETAPIPVIFMSALNEAIDRIKGFEVGAADFVSKPFELNETLARIKTHIQLFENTIRLEKYHHALLEAYVAIEANKRRSSITRMAAGIAHQVNTPLGNCRLAANTVESLVASLDAQIREGKGLSKSKIEVVFEQVLQGTTLLDRNLRILGSLIDKFKLLHFDGVLDVDRQDEVLFKQMLEFCMQELTELGYDTSSIEIDLGVEIEHRGYSSLLQSVILELTKNALQHGFISGMVEPKIQVSLSQASEQTLHLNVIDNGAGVTTDHVDQIFDPFFTTAMASGNLGLGLSLVHHLIEHILGGRVELHPTKDGGANFSITLPWRPLSSSF